jgi:hypothetical protein
VLLMQLIMNPEYSSLTEENREEFFNSVRIWAECLPNKAGEGHRSAAFLSEKAGSENDRL